MNIQVTNAIIEKHSLPNSINRLLRIFSIAYENHDDFFFVKIDLIHKNKNQHNELLEAYFKLQLEDTSQIDQVLYGHSNDLANNLIDFYDKEESDYPHKTDPVKYSIGYLPTDILNKLNNLEFNDKNLS